MLNYIYFLWIYHFCYYLIPWHFSNNFWEEKLQACILLSVVTWLLGSHSYSIFLSHEARRIHVMKVTHGFSWGGSNRRRARLPTPLEFWTENVVLELGYQVVSENVWVWVPIVAKKKVEDLQGAIYNLSFNKRWPNKYPSSKKILGYTIFIPFLDPSLHTHL